MIIETTDTINEQLNTLDLNDEPNIWITGGKPKKKRGWKSQLTTERELFESLACHEVGRKDGLAFLPGRLASTERSAKAVIQLDALVFDVDNGTPLDEVEKKLDERGVLACIYTSHSHGTAETIVPEDAIFKYVNGDTYCDADVLEYLKHIKGYHPAVLASASVGCAEHRAEGIVIQVEHQPMDKFRVVILLAEPFVFAGRKAGHKAAMAEWKGLYLGVAEWLGLKVDRSCTDPSRVYYFPRHDEGRPHESRFVLGNRLDLEAIELAEPGDQADLVANLHNRNLVTPWLKRLLAKHGREIDAESFFAGYLEERSPSNTGGQHFECPNDAAHSNAGDSDDTGFVAISALNNEEGTGFKAWCMHDSCRELDRADFLDMIIQEHGLNEADLLEFVDDESAGSSADLLRRMRQEVAGAPSVQPVEFMLPDGFREKNGKFYRMRGKDDETLVCNGFRILGKARNPDGTGMAVIVEI